MMVELMAVRMVVYWDMLLVVRWVVMMEKLMVSETAVTKVQCLVDPTEHQLAWKSVGHLDLKRAAVRAVGRAETTESYLE